MSFTSPMPYILSDERIVITDATTVEAEQIIGARQADADAAFNTFQA